MFNAAAWSNPGQFSDLSTYSGLDDKKGMESLTDAYKKASFGIQPPDTGAPPSPSAVPPPSLFGNISNTASQLGQGNFSGAANSLGLHMPTLPTIGGASPMASSSNKMSSNFED
jgi:hypothetical protein